MHAIEIKDLSKKFKDFYAVNKVSFSVEEGQIFGLLGPNGAGKSTIMKILSTLMNPTEGEVKICGNDLAKNKSEIKKVISLVSDYTVLEDDLTPMENLKMFAEISVKDKSGIDSRINKLMEDFGLMIYKDRLTKNLSSGNKQKLNFARALVKNPKVLLLDEPTNAIDVETSRFIREYIIEENIKNKTTVIISSHYIWEVEQIASEIGVILNGKITLKEKTGDLFIKFNTMLKIYEVQCNKENSDNIMKQLKSHPKIFTVRQISESKIMVESENETSMNGFIYREIMPSLEDIYSYVVKKGEI